MKYFNKYLIAMMMALFVSAGYCLAKEQPRVLTLNDCIMIAIHNNPSIKVSEEDKIKAIADYNAALAQRLFSIDGTISMRQYPITSDKTSLNSSFYSALATQDPVVIFQQFKARNSVIDRVSLGSSYYSVGMAVGVTASISVFNEKKDQTLKSAKSGIKLSKLQALKAMYEVLINVKKTYYGYINAKEFYSLRETLLKSNLERLKITQILYDNGQRPLYDLSKAKLDVNDAQMEVLRSKNALRTARAELLAAMGTYDTSEELNLEDIKTLPELQLSIDELQRYAELNYPDFQMTKLQTEINKIKIAIEYAGHYPEVDLQFGGSTENGGFPTNSNKFFDNKVWSFSGTGNFVARFPIFSSGAVSSRVKSAESEYHKSVYKEREARMTMKSTVENSYESLKELKNQVEISKLMLENADKNSLIARKTYENGKGSQLELHDAYVSIVNSKIGYLKAKYDYLMAIARLSSIVGLGEDTLCKK